MDRKQHATSSAHSSSAAAMTASNRYQKSLYELPDAVSTGLFALCA
jgi:hypothetical protein